MAGTGQYAPVAPAPAPGPGACAVAPTNAAVASATGSTGSTGSAASTGIGAGAGNVHALTTSPESASASQPGSPAASTSTPPQSLAASAATFHHHPRGRLVSRACDRCRRRKAKVSLAQRKPLPFLSSCLGPWSLLFSSSRPLLSLSSSLHPLCIHTTHASVYVLYCIHNLTLLPRPASF